jgi:hypothetical protein
MIGTKHLRVPVGNGSTAGKRNRQEDADDLRRPVWLEATESFYKKLNRIANHCQLSRYEALSRGLDALPRETQVRNSVLNRSIKSPGQSEVFRRTMGQVSRTYWATVSLQERRERGRKNAQIRWRQRSAGET